MTEPRPQPRKTHGSLAFRVGCALATVAVLFHGWDLASDGRGELTALDLEERFMAAVHPNVPDDRLVLVAIDDAAWRELLARTSNWQLYADLLEAIARAKPKVVGLDIFLSEAVFENGFLSRLESMADPNATVDPAAIADLLEETGGPRLEATIHGTPFVLPYSCAAETTGALRTDYEASNDPPGFLAAAGAKPKPDAARAFAPLAIGGFVHPAPRFESGAVAVGHVCESLDKDGVLRNDLAVIETTRKNQHLLLPSFPLVIAGLALDVQPGDFVYEAEGVRIGPRLVPIRDQGRTLVGFMGSTDSYRTLARQGHPSQYAALDVISGAVPASRLAGKVVLVGGTWAGFRDGRITPFGQKMAAPERIAMEIDSIISGRRLVARPPWTTWVGISLTVLAGCLAAAAGAGLRVRRALLILAGGVVLLAATALTSFACGVWLDSTFPILGWMLGGLGAASFRWYEEEAERRFILKAFGQYAPPALVDEMLRNPDAVLLRGEEREITVLFADLRGFTSQSERESPVETVARLNEHFKMMSEIVLKSGGTVDKFVGDAIMAFWGAPLGDPDHARHACEAALEMLRTLERQNAERAGLGRLPVDMGIGLNSGPVVIGNMGAEGLHVSYTAIGDTVNVAARLESLTKDLELPVLVGERTRVLAQANEALRFVPLGAHALKGKSAGVAVFALEDARRPATWRAILPG